MTPLPWLHVTTLLAGPAVDFSPDKLRQMTETAAGLLANTPAASDTVATTGTPNSRRGAATEYASPNRAAGLGAVRAAGATTVAGHSR